jgi:ribosomal protein S18 acetylase RimI-like enzyme
MDATIERVDDIDAAFPELAALLEELHQYHQALRPHEFVPEWRSRWISYLRQDSERLVLLARKAGEPVGYLNGSIRRDPGLFRETYGYIDDAYVQPDLRRLGLGAAMLSRFEAWCREQGATEVRLSVAAANDVGFSFWQKSGFRPMSHTMTKSLAGGSA